MQIDNCKENCAKCTGGIHCILENPTIYLKFASCSKKWQRPIHGSIFRGNKALRMVEYARLEWTRGVEGGSLQGLQAISKADRRTQG